VLTAPLKGSRTKPLLEERCLKGREVANDRHSFAVLPLPQSAMLTAPLKGSRTKPLIEERCLKGGEVAYDRHSFEMLPHHGQLS